MRCRGHHWAGLWKSSWRQLLWLEFWPFSSYPLFPTCCLEYSLCCPAATSDHEVLQSWKPSATQMAEHRKRRNPGPWRASTAVMPALGYHLLYLLYVKKGKITHLFMSLGMERGIFFTHSPNTIPNRSTFWFPPTIYFTEKVPVALESAVSSLKRNKTSI